MSNKSRITAWRWGRAEWHC